MGEGWRWEFTGRGCPKENWTGGKRLGLSCPVTEWACLIHSKRHTNVTISKTFSEQYRKTFLGHVQAWEHFSWSCFTSIWWQSLRIISPLFWEYPSILVIFQCEKVCQKYVPQFKQNIITDWGDIVTFYQQVRVMCSFINQNNLCMYTHSNSILECMIISKLWLFPKYDSCINWTVSHTFTPNLWNFIHKQ